MKLDEGAVFRIAQVLHPDAVKPFAYAAELVRVTDDVLHATNLGQGFADVERGDPKRKPDLNAHTRLEIANHLLQKSPLTLRHMNHQRPGSPAVIRNYLCLQELLKYSVHVK